MELKYEKLYLGNSFLAEWLVSRIMTMVCMTLRKYCCNQKNTPSVGFTDPGSAIFAGFKNTLNDLIIFKMGHVKRGFL